MDNNGIKRRKILLDALALGVFSGINAAGLVRPSYALSSLPERLPQGRSIYKLSGNVMINGIPADINTQITADSIVQTSENSEIIFVVGSDAFILRSNSELEFSASGILIKSMRMISGALLGVFGKRETASQLVTSTATIGIRGTGIYAESNPDKSYLCTCYGHTRISARADPNVVTDIVTKYHDRPVFILSSAAKQKLIVPAPVFDHTDQELALIEALVGRKTPFNPAGYDFNSHRVGGGGNY